MTDQIPPSQQPNPQFQPEMPQISPEQLEALKARARELAIQQTLEQQRQRPQPPMAPPQPNVVYVRRNLTLAEVILLFFLATTSVVAVQTVWSFVGNYLPRIEVKVK